MQTTDEIVLLQDLSSGIDKSYKITKNKNLGFMKVLGLNKSQPSNFTEICVPGRLSHKNMMKIKEINIDRSQRDGISVITDYYYSSLTVI